MIKSIEILQFVFLTAFITAGNITGFDTQVIRLLSVIILIAMTPMMYYIRMKSGLSMIHKGVMLFMLLNILIFWIFPQKLGQVMFYSPLGILYAIFFAVIFFSAILMKSNFTEYYAKKTTPQEFWETDIFKIINRNMSLVWAGIFAVSAFITFLPYLLPFEQTILTGYAFQLILPLIIMIGVGIPFNKRYPEYIMRKSGLDQSFTNPGISTPAFTEYKKDENKSEDIMNKLKITAINGSPHGNVGSTSQMIQMIGSAIAEQGITFELEEIFLSEKHIEYCVGCGFCLENARCWRKDDHPEIIEKLLNADAVILGSPVYFSHVTAQMKTFLDRSLSFGHKPRTATKPGIAVSVSAGMGEAAVGRYLEGVMHVFGAFSVGALTSMAVNPGGFLGKDAVQARAKDLASDLIRAIKEKRTYPVTDETYQFYLFMRDLVTREKEFMKGDYRHWQESGLLDRFESYVKQNFTELNYDEGLRKEWLKGLMQESKKDKREKTQTANLKNNQNNVNGPESVNSCYELLKIMPMGFRHESANGLKAVYQFQITGDEEFTAHLAIENGDCSFHEGNHSSPDVVINSPADIWLAISKGELDGQAAFMQGKYKVTGDLTMLMKMNSMFGNA
ncbi:MAG: NAD(P)H-dependent oxidoreductase [Spirochaetes bacterium]|nr:NAD(P)H-dependent oxidoreductase [Spirochaetota bacterium]